MYFGVLCEPENLCMAIRWATRIGLQESVSMVGGGCICDASNASTDDNMVAP